MAFAAAAAIAAAGAAAYGAYETGQAASRNARAQNNALALQRRQMGLSEQQQEAAFAGTTNARGDRTTYIPGVGWVEQPSARTAQLIGASDQEELARLTQDLPRARMNREAAFGQQQVDRGLATAMLSRMGEGTRNLADVEAGAVRQGVAEQTAGPDRTNNALLLTALRQGSGGIDALRSANTGNQGSTRAVLEGARNSAPQALFASEDARQNGALGRYNTMMNRATAPDGVNYAPNTLADSMLASRMGQQRLVPYGLGQAASTIQPAKMYDTDTRYGSAAQSGMAALRDIYKDYKAGNFDFNPKTKTTTATISDRGSTSKDYRY